MLTDFGSKRRQATAMVLFASSVFALHAFQSKTEWKYGII